MYLLVIEISYFTLINKKRKRKKKLLKNFSKGHAQHQVCILSGFSSAFFNFMCSIFLKHETNLLWEHLGVQRL